MVPKREGIRRWASIRCLVSTFPSSFPVLMSAYCFQFNSFISLGSFVFQLPSSLPREDLWFSMTSDCLVKEPLRPPAMFTHSCTTSPSFFNKCHMVALWSPHIYSGWLQKAVIWALFLGIVIAEVIRREKEIEKDKATSLECVQCILRSRSLFTDPPPMPGTELNT